MEDLKEEQLNRALSEYQRAVDIIDSFVPHIKANGTSLRFSSGLSLDGMKLSTNMLGYDLSAQPRVIRNTDGFTVAYAFFAAATNEAAPVWTFFLTTGGEIAADIEGNDRICDFDNPYLGDNLLSKLAIAVLNSRLFYVPTASG